MKIRSRRSKICLLFCVYTIMFTKSLKQKGEREIMASDSILKMILPYLKPKQGSLNWQLESLEEKQWIIKHYERNTHFILEEQEL